MSEFTGHPGQPAPEETPSDKTVDPENKVESNKITVGGKEFIVSDEMAAALSQQEALNRQINESNAMLKNELGSVKQSLEELKPAPDKPDEDNDFWSDPQGYMKVEIEKAVNSVKNDLTAEQIKKNEIDRFWEEFYKENEDLKKYNRIVDATINAIPNLGQMDVEQAKKTLADESRKYMASIMPKADTDSPVVESPTNHDSSPPADDTAKVLGMGDIIKQRRMALRKASK